MHEAEVGVFVVVLSEKEVPFEILNAAMVDRVWIRDNVGSVGKLGWWGDCFQLLQYLSCLLLEGTFLGLRNVLPGDVEADSGDPLLYEYISFVDLSI